MDVVLNELLWSMEYQEQLCMIDIREDHCEFGCSYAPLFIFGENQRINAVGSYACKAVDAATCLPAWVGIAQPDVA